MAYDPRPHRRELLATVMTFRHWTPTQKALFRELLFLSGRRGLFPRQGELARRVGCGRDWVSKLLGRMAREGVLGWERGRYGCRYYWSEAWVTGALWPASKSTTHSTLDVDGVHMSRGRNPHLNGPEVHISPPPTASQQRGSTEGTTVADAPESSSESPKQDFKKRASAVPNRGSGEETSRLKKVWTPSSTEIAQLQDYLEPYLGRVEVGPIWKAAPRCPSLDALLEEFRQAEQRAKDGRRPFRRDWFMRVAASRWGAPLKKEPGRETIDGYLAQKVPGWWDFAEDVRQVYRILHQGGVR